MKKSSKILLYLILTFGLFVVNVEINLARYASVRATQYKEINNWMGFWVNSDVPVFVSASMNPSEIVRSPERQSRPAFVLTGYLLGETIYALARPLLPKLDQTVDKMGGAQFREVEVERKRKAFCHYAGFVLFNAVLLWIAVWLFQRLIFLTTGAWRHSAGLYHLVVLLVCIHPISKLFLWTVHTQLFNIVLPLYAIYILQQLMAGNWEKKQYAGYALLSGILLLYYGSFLVMLPLLLGGYLWQPSQRQTPRVEKAFFTFLLLLLFALPNLMWIFVLALAGVTYVNPELVKFRQFIWVYDAMSVSWRSFLENWAANSLLYLQTLGALVYTAMLFVAALLLSKPAKTGNRYALFTIPALVFGLLFLFFWMLGYYADRLGFSVCVPVFYAIAVALNSRNMTRTNEWIMGSMLVTWFLLNIITHPTHFFDTFYK